MDNEENPLIVTDIVSFANQLKTTVSALPAPRTQQSVTDIISALATCRLVCSIRDPASTEVQNVYVASLPTEPTVKWVCVFCSSVGCSLSRVINIFSARHHGPIYRARYMSSVRHKGGSQDQPKAVEVRIVQFSPYSSAIPLVFEG